jgi:hypothetical protein
MSPWRDLLDQDGIVCVPDVLSGGEVDQLLEQIAPHVGEGAGERGLYSQDFIRDLAVNRPLAEFANAVLSKPGPGRVSAVRVLYFDKHAGANWKVPYHQDVTIAVQEKIPIPEFSGWSEKGGVTHVRAPREILTDMLAIRLHLDDCGPENGPLRAIPGTHRRGKISRADVLEIVGTQKERVYASPRGGVILMRPLTLHASSAATMATHRRVLHIEYANTDHLFPLAWHLEWPINP